jgi:hypothetical protein
MASAGYAYTYASRSLGKSTGFMTVAIIVVVDLITTAKGGSRGQAPGAFTFHHTTAGGFNGVFYGIIFGVTSYSLAARTGQAVTAARGGLSQP